MDQLDQLPPDQASALRLLSGGRTYSEVADLLGLTKDAVEQTALAGADGLAGESAQALTEGERLRVLSVVLSFKADDPLISGSPAAAKYAEVVSAGIGESLPPKPKPVAVSPSKPAPTLTREAIEPKASLSPNPVQTLRPSAPAHQAATGGHQRGAALLAGLVGVVLLGGLLIWQPWSGGSSGNTEPTTKPAAKTPTKSGSTGANGWTVRSKYELKPSSGGSAKALAGIETKGSSAALLIAGNGVQAGSTIGIWLTGPGGPGLVGFQKVNAKGQFSAIGPLPKNVSTATQIVVTQETTTPGGKVPTQPGPVLLSSSFSFQ